MWTSSVLFCRTYKKTFFQQSTTHQNSIRRKILVKLYPWSSEFIILNSNQSRTDHSLQETLSKFFKHLRPYWIVLVQYAAFPKSSRCVSVSLLLLENDELQINQVLNTRADSGFLCYEFLLFLGRILAIYQANVLLHCC